MPDRCRNAEQLTTGIGNCQRCITPPRSRSAVHALLTGGNFALAFAERPLSKRISHEMLPGKIAEHCRRTVKTNWHPVGTCRMGPNGDPLAVLDPRLRVRGVAGLRVIDASAMPFIPSGNTNAPTMALADRAIALL